MDDKNLMENILLLEKGVCDLLMHGTIESTTSNVHQTFNTALGSALNMQDQIWYPTEQAEQNKGSKVKQKFSSQCSG